MDIINQLFTYIKRYKWLLLPLIPMAMFPLLLFLSLFPENLSNDQTRITPTQLPTPSLSSDLSEYDYGSELEEPLDKMPGFQKKESKSDGTTIYSYTSTNPSRENILITEGEEIVFDRFVISPEYPVTISQVTKVYGQPERILQSPTIYGENTQIYIYATDGIAFIVNPTTNQVMEQHTFFPMNVDDYIIKYGENFILNTNR